MVGYYTKWVKTSWTYNIYKHKRRELPAVRRTQPITKKAKISLTTHVQLLQWSHGKQQQYKLGFRCGSEIHSLERVEKNKTIQLQTQELLYPYSTECPKIYRKSTPKQMQ